MNVVAIERRDKGFVQQRNRRMGNAIGTMFQVFNSIDIFGATQLVFVVLQQLDHCRAALIDQRRVLIEELKKLALARH